MGFTTEEIGNLTVIKYQFPVDHGKLIELYPCWRVKLDGVVLEDIKSVTISEDLDNPMSSCDVEFVGIMNNVNLPLSCDKIITVEQGYNNNYLEIYRGIIDDRNLSETSKSENFSIMSRDMLAKVAHPWYNTLLNKYYETKVKISTIIGYCAGLAGMSCIYSAFDWELPNYDMSGKYPIDVISEFANKIYAQVQVIGNIVYFSPKIPRDLNNVVLTIRDNNDIVIYNERNSTDQYFNRIAISSGTQRFYNNRNQNDEHEKVVDYYPTGFNRYIYTPEIPTLNGSDDPATYEQNFNNWADANATTIGAGIITSDLFSSRDNELPCGIEPAPSFKYTNDDNVYFEKSFLNTGAVINSSTLKAYGGVHKESNGSHSYSGAEYIVGSYGLNIGRVRIPYTITDNSEYQPWNTVPTNPNIKDSMAIRDLWYDATTTVYRSGAGEEYSETRIENITPIKGLIDTLSVTFPEGQTGRWFYLKEKKTNTDIVCIWGTLGTIASSYDSSKFTDVSNERLYEPDGPYLYPNIDIVVDGSDKPAPVFSSDAFRKTTDENGVAYFPSVPICSVDYTRSKSMDGYDFKNQSDMTFDPSYDVIEETYKYAHSGGSKDPSRYKKIINDTEYNWVVTAKTTDQPFGAPIPVPTDWTGTVIVDKLSEIQSFGRVVQPLHPIEDQIITDTAIAYYIANGFLNLSVARKRRMNVKIPSVPIRLKGKVIRIVDTRLDIDLNLYVISQKRNLTKKGMWDNLDVLRFVL